MSDTLNVAKAALQSAQDKNAVKYRTNKLDLSYAVDEYVLLSSKNIKLMGDGSWKFHPRSIGPFKIVQKVGKVSFVLDLPGNISKLYLLLMCPFLTMEAFFKGSASLSYPRFEGETLWLFERTLDHRKED